MSAVRAPRALRPAPLLVAVGVTAGAVALLLRLLHGDDLAVRALEAGALVAAAGAYLVHLVGTRPSRRDLVLRSGLVVAFLLWAAAQAFPAAGAAPFLNDGAIVLFVADLIFTLLPAAQS